MTTLATAIERKQWDFVALCLLIGIAEVAATLPAETLEQLLELLDLEPLEPERRPAARRAARGEGGLNR